MINYLSLKTEHAVKRPLPEVLSLINNSRQTDANNFQDYLYPHDIFTMKLLKFYANLFYAADM